jgi:hypothetical protein
MSYRRRPIRAVHERVIEPFCGAGLAIAPLYKKAKETKWFSWRFLKAARESRGGLRSAARICQNRGLSGVDAPAPYANV